MEFIPKVLVSFFQSISFDQYFSLKSILHWFKSEEAKRRLLFTSGVFLILQLLFLIPLPGIDKHLFGNFANSKLQMSKMSIFSIGLMPFINSCIILQIFSMIIKPLRALSFKADTGRDKLAKYTYLLTIILALIYSFGFSTMLLTMPTPAGIPIVKMPGTIFVIITTLSMTTAVVLLLLVANLINKYGIGNGFAIVSVSGMFWNIILAIKSSSVANAGDAIMPVILLLIFIVMIYILFYITRLSIKIEIENTKSYKLTLPIRPTLVGKVPASIALALLYTAGTSTFLGFIHQATTGHMYLVLLSLLTIIFTYIYSLVVYDPKYINDLIGKYGFRFNSKDRSFHKAIDSATTKILLLTSLVLVSLQILPRILSPAVRASYSSNYYPIIHYISTLSFLVIIGVFSDIISQIEFFIQRNGDSIKNWKICHVASDEIEAEIKKGYLGSSGITALIKPYRYSWGMPIRTMIDKYEIYVPEEVNDKARQLIENPTVFLK